MSTAIRDYEEKINEEIKREFERLYFEYGPVETSLGVLIEEDGFVGLAKRKTSHIDFSVSKETNECFVSGEQAALSTKEIVLSKTIPVLKKWLKKQYPELVSYFYMVIEFEEIPPNIYPNSIGRAKIMELDIDNLGKPEFNSMSTDGMTLRGLTPPKFYVVDKYGLETWGINKEIFNKASTVAENGQRVLTINL